MRLTGYRQGRKTHIGRLDGKGGLAPLGDAEDFYADIEASMARARAVSDYPLKLADVEERPAVTPSARVLCVGLNYRAHAAEGGFQVPDFPTIFGRWTASLVSGGVPVPAIDVKTDWEGELGVIVGKPMTNVSEDKALDYVLGYACFNDISSRTYQRHTSQWTPGKNSDRSGPMGPIVTADETGDPATGWRLQTRVNGTVVQDANTSDMVFSVPKILSYLSQIMTLNPGDVIASGTPEGVGHARTPPWFMKAGDSVEVEIEGLGVLTNPIVGADQRP